MTDAQRGAGRIEHLIVDRLVPVLLIVILPMLGAIYWVDRNAHESRRDQIRASCERGNDIRRDQRAIIDLLGQASAVLSVGAGDQDVRDYFAQSVTDLRARRERIKVLDCVQEIP